MTDLFKSKEHEFYIELKQERYYFPGEDILGDVILDITKATKTNNIKVVLEGTVEIGGRTMTLFSKYVLIAQSRDGEKSYYLEPLTHRFPFVITIPTAKECSVPSTLEIIKLLKVSYRLTAIFNKPFAVLEKFSASTTTYINILENINVESTKYSGDYKVEKKLFLTGEAQPVTVSAVIGKRAAVKGDTIAVLVIIEHIGVMVRDRAISIQLLRSVYYGRNESEIFGPKILKEVTSNIEILGPVNFTKTFDLRLAIPTNLCPTVEKSGQSFKIEYTLRISVNLNEENPHRPEVAQNVVLISVPFTIGTYPKLSFNIDDDDEDDEEEVETKGLRKDEVASNHSSEYDEVAEKMKEMDLSLEAVPPKMIQQSPRPSAYTPPPALSTSPKSTYIPPPILVNQEPEFAPLTSPKPTYIPPPMLVKQEPQPQIKNKDAIIKSNVLLSPSSVEHVVQVPMVVSKPLPIPPMPSSPAIKPLERLPSSTAVSPMMNTPPIVKPLERPSSNGSNVSSFPTPKMEFATHSPQQQPNPPTSKMNIRPSEIYNDYQPGLSPTSSVHRHDSLMQPSTSTSSVGLGRQDSEHWIVRNKDAPTAATVANTSSVMPNGYRPALPPRPTPPVNNNAQPGFNLTSLQFTSPEQPSSPFRSSNNYQRNNNNNQHYTQGHHPYPPPAPLQHYDSFSGGMPVVQPAPPPPPPQYNNYNYQYGSIPSPQLQQPYNHHPLQQCDNNVSFPVPQQYPHTHAEMMSMPSYQNYVPSHLRQEQQYHSYYNH